MESTEQRWMVSPRSYHGCMGYAALRYAVFPAAGLPVDYFRTRAAAEHAARELNAGRARVDAHAVIGCRVVQS